MTTKAAVVWNRLPPASWTAYYELFQDCQSVVSPDSERWALFAHALVTQSDSFSQLLQSITETQQWASVPGVDVRLAADGSIPDWPMFTSRRQKRGFSFIVPSPTMIRARFAEGHTLIVEGAERYLPVAQWLAFGASAAFGCTSQVNLYVTPPGGRGFRFHADSHDVLVIQVSGTKRWLVGEMLAEASRPTRSHSTEVVDPSACIQVDLSVGDVLYLPRGTVHAASNESEDVVAHATLGLHWPVLGDLLQAGIRRLMAIGHLRRHWTGTDGRSLRMPDAALHAAMVEEEALSVLKWVPHPIGPLQSVRPAASDLLSLATPVCGLTSGNETSGQLWVSGTPLELPPGAYDDVLAMLGLLTTSGVQRIETSGVSSTVLDDLLEIGAVVKQSGS